MARLRSAEAELADEVLELRRDLDTAYKRIRELQVQVEILLDAVHKAAGDLNQVIDVYNSR